MKRSGLIIAALATTLMFGACNSGNSQNEGKDSVRNGYDAPSNVDTSAVTSTTGDASLKDNSGAGGAPGKDTTKRDTSVQQQPKQ
jgi:protein involved in sex pheromone biosynthesis